MYLYCTLSTLYCTDHALTMRTVVPPMVSRALAGEFVADYKSETDENSTNSTKVEYAWKKMLCPASIPVHVSGFRV